MATKPVNYQKLNSELEQILAQMQSGELDIDESIKLYERGQKIVKELQTYLKATENKISKVQASKK